MGGPRRACHAWHRPSRHGTNFASVPTSTLQHTHTHRASANKYYASRRACGNECGGFSPQAYDISSRITKYAWLVFGGTAESRAKPRRAPSCCFSRGRCSSHCMRRNKAGTARATSVVDRGTCGCPHADAETRGHDRCSVWPQGVGSFTNESFAFPSAAALACTQLTQAHRTQLGGCRGDAPKRYENARDTDQDKLHKEPPCHRAFGFHRLQCSMSSCGGWIMGPQSRISVRGTTKKQGMRNDVVHSQRNTRGVRQALSHEEVEEERESNKVDKQRGKTLREAERGEERHGQLSTESTNFARPWLALDEIASGMDVVPTNCQVHLPCLRQHRLTETSHGGELP